MTVFIIGLSIVYFVGVIWALFIFTNMDNGLHWYNVKGALLWPRFILFNLTLYGKIVLAAVIAVVIALLLLFSSGCAPRLVPTVLTESKAGEPLTMQQVEKTGSRADVPAGKKARQVVSQTSLVHAGGNVGKIIVTRGFWPWTEVDVYTNCAQCHKDAAKLLSVEQPKRPWYFWPAWILIGLAIVAGIIALLYLRGLLAPVISFLKPLLTKR